MTIDLMTGQSLTILLPDGARLVLTDATQSLRLEHWQNNNLSSLLSLPTHHDPLQPPHLDQ